MSVLRTTVSNGYTTPEPETGIATDRVSTILAEMALNKFFYCLGLVIWPVRFVKVAGTFEENELSLKKLAPKEKNEWVPYYEGTHSG